MSYATTSWSNVAAPGRPQCGFQTPELQVGQPFAASIARSAMAFACRCFPSRSTPQAIQLQKLRLPHRDTLPSDDIRTALNIRAVSRVDVLALLRHRRSTTEQLMSPSHTAPHTPTARHRTGSMPHKPRCGWVRPSAGYSLQTNNRLTTTFRSHLAMVTEHRFASP